MKTKTITLLFLSLTIKQLFAATGSRNDDFLVVLLPILLLVIIAATYKVKAIIKAKKTAQADSEMIINNPENSSPKE